MIPRASKDAFAERLEYYRRRVDDKLAAVLGAGRDVPERLLESMRYSVLGGGKRVRPLLVYASGELAGAAEDALDALAAAVELIHAYSLVHDDLPAMDNDDLRRGRPTTHKQFDEATAILAGDGLQALAFEILATDPALDVAPRNARSRSSAGSRARPGPRAWSADRRSTWTLKAGGSTSAASSRSTAARRAS